MSNDRTDYNTLISVLEKYKESFGDILEEVTADSGDCSEKKTRAYTEDIGTYYRSTEKVYKEFMLYAIGRNINKYHRFLHGELRKFEGKTGEKTA